MKKKRKENKIIKKLIFNLYINFFSVLRLTYCLYRDKIHAAKLLYIVLS